MAAEVATPLAMLRSGVPAIWLFFAGIVAADATRSIVIKG